MTTDPFLLIPDPDFDLYLAGLPDEGDSGVASSVQKSRRQSHKSSSIVGERTSKIHSVENHGGLTPRVMLKEHTHNRMQDAPHDGNGKNSFNSAVTSNLRIIRRSISSAKFAFLIYYFPSDRD